MSVNRCNWRLLSSKISSSLNPFLKFTLSLLILYVFATQTVYSEETNNHTLVVGSEEEYPPFSIGYTDDTADGFTVELWKAVAAKSKLDFVIHVAPFKSLLLGIQSGEVDVLINLAQSEERRKFVDFTVPHVTVSGGIFVRKSNKSIYSESDLADKKIIVITADLAHDYALSKSWKKNLVMVDSASKGFELLSSGKHDAILINKLVGQKTINQLQIDNVKLVETNVGFQQKFSFAVKKGNSDLLAKINEGLSLVKEHGEYDEIYDKWFAIYNLDRPIFSNAFYISLILTIISIFAAIYLFYKRSSDNSRAINKIRETNKSFENVLSAATQFSIITTDIEGQITIFNAGAQTMLGYKSTDLVGKVNITKLHDAAELQLRRSKQSEYFNLNLTLFDSLTCQALSEGYEKFDCEYISIDGKKIDVTVNVSPMRNSEDSLVGYLFIAQDITERKSFEFAQIQYLEKLYQSESLKSAMLDCSPLAIMIMNQDGNFVEFNPAAEKMFDYQRSEVIGKKVADVIMTQTHRERHEHGFKSYIKSGKSTILGRKVVVPSIKRDGSQFQLEMVVIPFDFDQLQYFICFASEESA